MIPNYLRRFLKYAAIGGSTFGLDLALLYVLVTYVSVNYVIASGISFFLAISLNYVLSRNHVFKGSERLWKAGYINFVAVALIGLVVVTAGMYVFVGILHANYLLSRIGIAIVTGFCNYLFNLFINFNVAGKY
ncbi:hypothetical protein BH11PAT2_BH11PAT2_00960 [soil metagenome]